MWDRLEKEIEEEKGEGRSKSKDPIFESGVVFQKVGDRSSSVGIIPENEGHG